MRRISSFIPQHLLHLTMDTIDMEARNKLWPVQYDMIKKMRRSIVAPVDSIGAGPLAKSEPNQSEKEFRFSSLIVAMLSPQTKDQQTSEAYQSMRNLVRPRSFLASTIMDNVSIESLEQAIKSASFHKTKAKNIMDACKRMVTKYNDDLPLKIEELLEFQGVGPKIAYLTFSIGWNKTEGICVDTHVYRIVNRLGWVSTWNTSYGPEKTRILLESFLPKEIWFEINEMLVGFGQTICSAKIPKCSLCTLQSSCKYHLSNSGSLKDSGT